MKEDSNTTEHSELLLLPDGRILAHNITPDVAGILLSLDPQDALMARRAIAKDSRDAAARD